MKKVIKKIVSKKPLRKAQTGTEVKREGPMSPQAASRIRGAEYKRKSFPLSTDQSIQRIKEYDLDPKNSKRISKDKSPKYKMSKGEKKNYKQDYKNLPKNSDEKKESRTAAVGSAILNAALSPLYVKMFKKGWNLEKKRGGAVQTPIKSNKSLKK
jgi:hypothetical protein